MPSSAPTAIDGVVAVSAVEEAAADAHEAATVNESVTPYAAGAPPEDSVTGEPETAAATDPLDDVREQLSKILGETEKYNTRAAQREGVIDSMHAELERLRHGERRSLLRPLVSEVCRLRDDILRQAGTLPDPFDATKAVDLLRSYADSLEFALEDNGIFSYAPEAGDTYEARLHRASGKTPTTDGELVGKIATVVSPGYRDVEAETVIAAARVTVFALDESAPASANEPTGGTVADASEPEPAATATAPDETAVAELSRPKGGDAL